MEYSIKSSATALDEIRASIKAMKIKRLFFNKDKYNKQIQELIANYASNHFLNRYIEFANQAIKVNSIDTSYGKSEDIFAVLLRGKLIYDEELIDCDSYIRIPFDNFKDIKFITENEFNFKKNIVIKKFNTK
jgi:hypothetical protein